MVRATLMAAVLVGAGLAACATAGSVPPEETRSEARDADGRRDGDGADARDGDARDRADVDADAAADADGDGDADADADRGRDGDGRDADEASRDEGGAEDAPPDELCDGLDNDDDGETDEGYDVGGECTVGEGICEAEGVLVCAEDGRSAICDGEPGVGTEETCNGEDDDCDGLVDEYGICVTGSCAEDPPGTPWCFYPFADASTTPAIGPDGTIYVTTSSSGGGTPQVHAIDPEDCGAGWTYTHGDPGYITSPAVGEDGTIYAGFTGRSGDVAGRVLAIDSGGGLAWSLPLTGTVNPTDLARSGDGTIYFGDGYSGGHFYAVNSGGTLKWSLDPGGSEFRGAPAIGPDGTVYAGTWQYFSGPAAAVYAIVDEGTRGRVEWEFAPAGGAFTQSHSPAIGADGTVYVGLFIHREGNVVLYALDPEAGEEVWHYTMGASTTTNSGLVVAADGTIYAKSTDGLVYAILPDGTDKWAPFDTGAGGWYEATALGAEDLLYVGANGRFFCLDADDGSVVWETAIDGIPGSPTINPAGTVFFPTSAAFYGLCATSLGLAEAPWPKDLHEERNSADSRAP